VREIDLAVHSMKDMPAIEHDALAIGAVSAREDPRDAFLSHSAMKLAELPKGARVGTSSVRRTAQLARARSDLEIMLLRGNVDTRLAKLDAGQYDAIILAHAGLKRLGLAARATSLFELREWLPALSQGAVGVQLRKDDDHTYKTINVLNDTTTFVATVCERAFQMALDGTCRTPIAGLATYAAGRLAFRGEVLAPDGSDFVETQFDVPLDSRTAAADAHRLGFEAGMALKPRAACWLAL
jgi:hydroxymethylbilane synthase